jgi:hypothetical protein
MIQNLWNDADAAGYEGHEENEGSVNQFGAHSWENQGGINERTAKSSEVSKWWLRHDKGAIRA